jgi:hypothetical protein
MVKNETCNLEYDLYFYHRGNNDRIYVILFSVSDINIICRIETQSILQTGTG